MMSLTPSGYLSDVPMCLHGRATPGDISELGWTDGHQPGPVLDSATAAAEPGLEV